MRKNINLYKIGLLLLSLALFAGCAEKKSIVSDGTNVVEEEEEAPPIQEENTCGTNTAPDTTGWGPSAPLVIDHNNFQAFTGRFDIPNFQDTRFFYKLEKQMINGKAHYKGSARVYYKFTRTQGGWGPGSGNCITEHKSPKFESGSTNVDIKYNRVYAQNGKQYLVGFFEEKFFDEVTNTYIDFINWYQTPSRPFGSIMVVFDLSQGSEEGANGKLYFRNFQEVYPHGNKPQSNNERYKCWNITEGPYSCREFVTNGYSTNWNDMLKEVNGQIPLSTYTDFENPYHYTELGEINGVWLPQ